MAFFINVQKGRIKYFIIHLVVKLLLYRSMVEGI